VRLALDRRALDREVIGLVPVSQCRVQARRS